MDRNSEKWSQKGYHSLLFAAKVSVWRSFERFHSLNNRHRNFPHHSIPSRHVSYTTERFFWPHVETRLLIALFFLPFGTPDSGSKFRRYQVFIRYHWASAGMMKGHRLPKRKRNVLRRDDYFYFHHYPFQICITDQAWGQHDWIYGQIPFFLHFARLSRSKSFIFSWLVIPRDFVPLSAGPHALKLVFGHF